MSCACVTPARSPSFVKRFASISDRITAENTARLVQLLYIAVTAGARRQRLGVFLEISSMVSTEICSFRNPNRSQEASRWSTELEEARSHIHAFGVFKRGGALKYRAGAHCFSYSSLPLRPCALQEQPCGVYGGDGSVSGSAMRAPLKGSSWSFAVNMPEHDPTRGRRCIDVEVRIRRFCPRYKSRPPRTRGEGELFFVLCPASIGPPGTNAAGIFTLTAP